MFTKRLGAGVGAGRPESGKTQTSQWDEINILTGASIKPGQWHGAEMHTVGSCWVPRWLRWLSNGILISAQVSISEL